MASWLSVSMTKRDSCVLPWRWRCLPRAGDQAVGRCTIPALQRALLASPPAAKHDRRAARWGSGDFSTSVLTSVHSTVSQGPLPLPLAQSPAPPGLPSPPAVPRRVPRWGPQGLVDHLNLGGNEQSPSEPPPALGGSSPLQGGLGAACWRELDIKANSQLHQHIQEKSELGKKPSQPPPHHVGTSSSAS